MDQTIVDQESAELAARLARMPEGDPARKDVANRLALLHPQTFLVIEARGAVGDDPFDRAGMVAASERTSSYLECFKVDHRFGKTLVQFGSKDGTSKITLHVLPDHPVTFTVNDEASKTYSYYVLTALTCTEDLDDFLAQLANRKKMAG
jgi:hypothetical protein